MTNRPEALASQVSSSALTVSGQVSSQVVSAAVHADHSDRDLATTAGTTSGRVVAARAFSAGRWLRGALDRHGLTVDAAARIAGVGREKLSAALNDRAELRVDWLEAMPVDVVREYVTDLAARVGLRTAPLGDADSGEAKAHRVAVELTDVVRVGLTNEADGYLSAAEAAEELREVREARRALSDREALLLRVIDQRGAAVVR